jgi:hypothetical protein
MQYFEIETTIVEVYHYNLQILRLCTTFEVTRERRKTMTKTETFTEPELAVYSTLLGGGTIKFSGYGGGVNENAEFTIWSKTEPQHPKESTPLGWKTEDATLVDQEVIRALSARNLIKVERSEGESYTTQVATLALTDRALGGKYNSFNKTIAFD